VPSSSLAWPLVGDFQTVVHRLTVCSVNSNLTGRPVLSDSCAICGVTAGGNILNSDGNDVTAAKLAVDSHVEHGEVMNSTFRFWN